MNSPTTDELHEAIRAFCEANPWKGERPAPNGNLQIRHMLLAKYQTLYTTGQIAGLITRAGINRGIVTNVPPSRDENPWARPDEPPMLTPHCAARERGRERTAIEQQGKAAQLVLRRCAKCREFKPPNCYGPNSRDGRRVRCLLCDEAVIVEAPTKTCKTCGIDKPRDAFSVHLSTADKLFPDCKMCRRDHARARVANKPHNPDMIETRGRKEKPLPDIEVMQREAEDIQHVPQMEPRDIVRPFSLHTPAGRALINSRGQETRRKRREAIMAPEPAPPAPEEPVPVVTGIVPQMEPETIAAIAQVETEADVASEAWPEDRIAHLRSLLEHKSTLTEAAAIMGCTRNAISSAKQRFLPDLVERAAQPAYRLQAADAANRDPDHHSPFNNRVYLPPRPQTEIWASKPIPAPPTCHWPLGDPGTERFRFCGTKSHHGRPYCRPHCEVAYNNFDPHRFG